METDNKVARGRMRFIIAQRMSNRLGGARGLRLKSAQLAIALDMDIAYLPIGTFEFAEDALLAWINSLTCSEAKS